MSRKSKPSKYDSQYDPYAASLSYYSESSSSSHKGYQGLANAPPPSARHDKYQKAPAPSSSKAPPPMPRQGSGVNIKALGARIMQEEGSTQPSQRYKPGPSDLHQRRPDDKYGLPATLNRKPALRDPSRGQISRENTRAFEDAAFAAHAAEIAASLPGVFEHPQLGTMKRVQPTVAMRNMKFDEPGETLGFYQAVNTKSSRHADQSKSKDKEKKKKKGWFS